MMDPDRIATIIQELEVNETHELIKIWQIHDLNDWTEEAFEAIRQILISRNEEPPMQDDREAADLQLETAQTYLDQDQPVLALEACERAIGLAPHYAKPYEGKGDALADLEEWDQAIATYNHALRLDPHSRSVIESLEDTLKLREITPPKPVGKDEADQHLEQVQHFLDAGKLEEALAECDAAIQISPKYAQAQLARGLVLDEMDRLEDAIAAYESALKLDPGLDAATLNLKYASQELAKKKGQE
jgi:tetratricopeptide (TPR) repeat protein